MTGALGRLADNTAILMRWPPCNGGFTLGFNPVTARKVKQVGGIVLDGCWATVTPTSLADDDERVDFYFADQVALDVPQRGRPLLEVVAA